MSDYDPAARRERYLRTRKLKGRQPGAGDTTKGAMSGTRTLKVPPSKTLVNKEKRERVARLTVKLTSLTKALQEAQEALRNKRRTAKEDSDGKTTSKERQAAKEYRDKNKAKIAEKREAKADKESSTSKDSSPSKSGKKSVSSMSESELTERISKIKTAISDTKKLIQKANQ